MIKKLILPGVILIILCLLFVSPGYLKTGNKIKGKLIDALYVPGSGDQGVLWILTDGSLSFRYQKKSPGKTVTGRKGLFCKTYLYIYDPVNNGILKQTKTKYNSLPPAFKLFMINNAVWMVAEDRGQHKPIIKKYNPENGEELQNTESILQKFPGTQGGIVGLKIINKPMFHPLQFGLSTKDGRYFLYDPLKENLFKDTKTLENSYQPILDDTISVFALGRERLSESRKHVFKLTGQCLHLKNLKLDNVDTARIQRFYKSIISTPLAETKVFLDGWFIKQNSEISVIMHQDQIGKNANRLLTCMDSAGTTRFSLGSDELFQELVLKEKDSFSSTFFIKSRISGDIQKNIFIFKMDKTGIIGIDIKTGKILWKIDVD